MDAVRDWLNNPEQSASAGFCAVVAGFVACADVGVFLCGVCAVDDELAETFPAGVTKFWHGYLPLGVQNPKPQSPVQRPYAHIPGSRRAQPAPDLPQGQILGR